MISKVAVFHFFFLLAVSQAFCFEALRDPKKLWQAQEETVLEVTGAKVVLADYDLIRKDFAEVREFSNSQIDAWLIRNTAFISVQQAAQEKVNDTIRTTGQRRRAFRPREYRRAHVFLVDTGGLIDVKGTGAVDPSGGSHDNGLATLGDMIREYLFEKLIHAIFKKDRRFDTVGSYAVIDFGFDIKHPDGGKSRAGTILRQAHARYHDGPIGTRSRGQPVMLPRSQQLEIEVLLRKFGITSGVKYQGKELINIQGAENGAVIDFGSFLVERVFSHLVSYFYDKFGNQETSAEDIVMTPQDKNFIQPDEKLRIPFEIWGYSHSGKADSKFDNPYIWSHELAEALARGTASRADAEQHVRNFFDQDSVQEILRNIPASCKMLF